MNNTITLQITVLADDGLPVLSNGVEAMCAENIDCSFSYGAQMTPQLLEIQVCNIYYIAIFTMAIWYNNLYSFHFFQPTEATVGSTITLRGHGFIPTGTMLGGSISSVTVLIDKAPCQNVIARSSTPEIDEVQCTIVNYESGFYFVDVLVDGKGYASVSPTDLIPGDIRNSSSSPNTLSIYPTFFLIATTNGNVSPTSGSLLGGTLLTITGSGFSYVPSHVDVQIGGSPCHIV